MLKFLRWIGFLDDPGTWHAGGKVIACAYPRGRHLRRLVGAGVRIVVNLHPRSHSAALLSALGLEQFHLPTPDFAAPSLDQLRRGVSALRSATGAVVVHCGGGYGRTGTLLACMYVADGQAPDEAIAQVRAERPGAIETVSQEAVVYTFASERRIHLIANRPS